MITYKYRYRLNCWEIKYFIKFDFFPCAKFRDWKYFDPPNFRLGARVHTFEIATV